MGTIYKVTVERDDQNRDPSVFHGISVKSNRKSWMVEIVGIGSNLMIVLDRDSDKPQFKAVDPETGRVRRMPPDAGCNPST